MTSPNCILGGNLQSAYPCTAGWFIYEYQTLIGSILAVFAALLALLPVWKQLKFNALQANILHKDTLESLIKSQNAKRNALDSDLGQSIRNLYDLIIDPDGNTLTIDVNDAFHYHQIISQSLTNARMHLSSHDDDNLQRIKNKLFLDVETLLDTLDTCTTRVTREQSGDGYSFTDAEWALELLKSDQAYDYVESHTNAAQLSFGVLIAALDRRIGGLRRRRDELEMKIADHA